MSFFAIMSKNYNIPRKIRELQHKGTFKIPMEIITYQEKSGNYNLNSTHAPMRIIITYQEKSGNYNMESIQNAYQGIITYQEKSGNYNQIITICKI